VSMPDNSLQKNSTAFRLPALDPDFLLGDSMRGVRLQLEYAKAEERLRAWTVRSTVVVFGSARARPSNQLARWYEDAHRFAKLVSERGGALISDHGIRDNVIATGGGPGIMEAANRGAADAGAPSIGFNIGLPHEQEPNAYSTPDLTFQFHYFAVRKLHFAMRDHALSGKRLEIYDARPIRFVDKDDGDGWHLVGLDQSEQFEQLIECPKTTRKSHQRVGPTPLISIYSRLLTTQKRRSSSSAD
jgi:hypothetical protein